ncbi:hypothetical protein ACYFX5_01220 [Bremerella sp. T1]|uniref:hypothetical protein n=1 Tax=Bremerella sp. TYQ1 TaxID=3119568 RepID=UPI001CCE1D90|nr:hypothetical protein [Bremerella volcania]UBM36910.1 hypothetical protein LA756_03180 [Bremerella volcania]
MPCNWKTGLQDWMDRILEPAECSMLGQRPFSAAISQPQRHPGKSHVPTPPPWLSRKLKRPAQRGGPRI